MEDKNQLRSAASDSKAAEKARREQYENGKLLFAVEQFLFVTRTAYTTHLRRQRQQ